MKFKDVQLQHCYERNFVNSTGFPEDLREICALLAVYDYFRMLEGPHSERVHETLQTLISAEARPGLRQWYDRCGAEMSAAETAFRDHLCELIGDRLGPGARDMICNPS